MAVHVAIVIAMYERLILGGHKTIECRLTKTPREPFGRIAPGERVYFKRSGGPFFAAATVDRVWMADKLTPERVEDLRRQFDGQIHGSPEYWKSHRHSRYATLVWLREVEATTAHPRYKPQNMRAWYTLEGGGEAVGEMKPTGSMAKTRRAVTFTVTLSAGAVKNCYVRLGEHREKLPRECVGGERRGEAGAAITLRLSGGPVVQTDIIGGAGSRGMLRWRGWKRWFAESGLRAGDQLRFTQDGPRSFEVSAVRV